MKLNFQSLYVFVILFLVLGMSMIVALDFLYGITSAGVYNIVIFVILVLFLYGIATKKIIFPHNDYNKIFWIFTIAISFSLIFSNFSEFGIRKYFLFIGSGLLLTLFASSINKNMLKYLPYGFLLFGVLNMLVMIGYWRLYGDLSTLKWSMIIEIKTDVIYIARALGLAIVTAFFYIKNTPLKWLLIVSFLSCMLVLNEAGPFLAVILAIFFYYFRKNTVYLFLSVVSGILLYFFVIQNYISDLTIEGVLNDPRVDIYTNNLNYFLNNPVFGIGIAGSSGMNNGYQSAHNIFFEIAAEFGIVGLIPFLILIKFLFLKFLSNKEFFFGYIWLYSFIVVQFSGDIGLNPLFWCISAVFISIPKASISILNSKI